MTRINSRAAPNVSEGAVEDCERTDEPGLTELLRSRLWLFVVCAVVVPLVALGVSARAGKTYTATAAATVRPNVQFLLVGIRDPTLYQPGAEVALVNAGLAPRASIARRALDDAGLARRSSSSLLAALTVGASGNRIDFSVRDANPGNARRLATLYARRFTDYRHRLHEAAVRRTRARLAATVERLRREHKQTSPAYTTAMYLLSVLPSSADVRIVVDPASTATLASPRTAEVIISGVVAGLFLAALLAIVIPRRLAVRQPLRRHKDTDERALVSTADRPSAS